MSTTATNTTTNDAHVATVLAMYEAFGRRDLDGVLSRLDDDVTWDVVELPWTPHAAGVPWMLPRRGKAEILDFFRIVGAWEYERFEPVDVYVSDGGKVAVELHLVADLPNGTRIDELVMHLWTFGDDGKVTALRRQLDTAAHIAAAEA